MKVNDGTVLPAQSQVLVQRSQVFSNMLDKRPLSKAHASRQNHIIVPLATSQRKRPPIFCLDSDCHYMNDFLVSHDSLRIGGTASIYTLQTTQFDTFSNVNLAIR